MLQCGRSGVVFYYRKLFSGGIAGQSNGFYIGVNNGARGDPSSMTSRQARSARSL
jgi:hypothetical protein